MDCERKRSHLTPRLDFPHDNDEMMMPCFSLDSILFSQHGNVFDEGIPGFIGQDWIN